MCNPCISLICERRKQWNIALLASGFWLLEVNPLNAARPPDARAHTLNAIESPYVSSGSATDGMVTKISPEAAATDSGEERGANRPSSERPLEEPVACCRRVALIPVMAFVTTFVDGMFMAVPDGPVVNSGRR